MSVRQFMERLAAYLVPPNPGKDEPGSGPASSLTLLNAALASYEKEYEDLNETWRDIDRKAQGAIAISGIFLAAAFAFVRQDHPLEGWQQWVLALALASLVGSVLSSVLALKLRGVFRAPLGDRHRGLVKDMLRVDLREREECIDGYVWEQIAQWQHVNKSSWSQLGSKSVALRWSQGFLVAAILLTATMTLVSLFAEPITPAEGAESKAEQNESDLQEGVSDE